MLFSKRNRPGHGQQRDFKYCSIHNQRILQLGSCLTCNTIASICQAKGCIKSHQENQRIHSVLTIQYVQHVVKDFMSSDQTKKSYLKKMVSEYFDMARRKLQDLHEEIFQSIENFKFDNIVFREDQDYIIRKLITEDYNKISCAQIAIIIPKLIKYTNFEDGHFAHLREYLKNQKQKVVSILDGIILNLPYFRDNYRRSKQNQFVEISSQWLRQVNQKMKEITIRPKKLRIKYIDDQGEEQEKVNIQVIQRRFIKNLCTIDKITSVEEIEIYCVWNVKDQEFQSAFFQAIGRYPFLKRVTVFTGYKITSLDFIYEIISQGAVDVKVYEKDWAF